MNSAATKSGRGAASGAPDRPKAAGVAAADTDARGGPDGRRHVARGPARRHDDHQHGSRNTRRPTVCCAHDGARFRRGAALKPVIGYLHTGMEKTGEELTYVQGGTNVTRMDYARTAVERARLLHGGRAVARRGGPAPGGVDPNDARRAQPHVVALAVPGHEWHGHRRGVDDDLRVAGAGGDAAIPRVGDRPANEPQLHPAGRRRGRSPRRLAGTRPDELCTVVEQASGEYDRC